MLEPGFSGARIALCRHPESHLSTLWPVQHPEQLPALGVGQFPSKEELDKGGDGAGLLNFKLQSFRKRSYVSWVTVRPTLHTTTREAQVHTDPID